MRKKVAEHLLAIAERRLALDLFTFRANTVSWEKETVQAGRGRGLHCLERRGLEKDPGSP